MLIGFYTIEEVHRLEKIQLLDKELEWKEQYDKALTSMNNQYNVSKIFNISSYYYHRVLMQEKSSEGDFTPKWLDPYLVVKAGQDYHNIPILKQNKLIT